MERLTDRNADGNYFYPKCFENCDGLGASRKCDNCEITTSICEKLGKYEDLEEHGLMIKLPCKVGDKYYRVVRTCSMAGIEEKGDFFPVKSDCDLWCSCNHKNPCDKEYMILENTFQSLMEIIYRIKDIGVIYFLTEEEAKEKRKELEETENKLREIEIGERG